MNKKKVFMYLCMSSLAHMCKTDLLICLNFLLPLCLAIDSALDSSPKVDAFSCLRCPKQLQYDYQKIPFLLMCS